jgi:hypothetical protein
VKVGEATERVGFTEPVVHVEGTKVAFLRKRDSEPGADDSGIAPDQSFIWVAARRKRTWPTN